MKAIELNVAKIAGVGEFVREEVKGKDGAAEKVIYGVPDGKAFLVERKNTIEVRSDRKLARLLEEQYESIMESRYFGKNGIEIVMSGQLSDEEVEDLVRLSYNLAKEIQ